MKKGYKMSLETKKKMSLARLGKKFPYIPHYKKRGQLSWNKGLKGYMAGKKHYNWKGGLPKCKDCKKQLSNRYAIRCRQCDKKLYIGSNNPSWKGGITPINRSIRTSKEYELWRKSVYERDNYTCIWCGQIGGKLNADHIKPFSLYPELRFAIDNGRTLCEECHKTTETFGSKSRLKNK